MAMKVACIDIGSNAVRYLIAEVEGEEIIEIAIGGEITGASDAIDASGSIDLSKLAPTVEALREFVRLAKCSGALPVCALATATLRDAKNSAEVITAIEEAVGIPVICLSQRSEARLGFYAAISALPCHRRKPNESLLYADVGGRSTELILSDAIGDIRFERSLKIGSRTLTKNFISSYPIAQSEQRALHSEIAAQLQQYEALVTKCSHFIVAGGTAVALAMLKRSLSSFSTDILHGAELTKEEVTSALEKFAGLPLNECEALLGFEPKRAPIFYAGVAIIASFMELGGFERAIVSAKCLMHGALERLIRMGIDLNSCGAIAEALKL